MKSVSKPIGFTLSACLFSTAIAAATTYVVPQSNALDSQGRRVYVDDAALKAAIPDLAGAGERSSTCATSMTTPAYLWLAFGPTVTGAHVGRVANVSCAFEGKEGLRERIGDLTCDQVRFESVGFDDDSTPFFRSDASVESGEARELFHAVFTGQLRFADSVWKKPDISTLHNISISKEGSALIARWGDCGCTFTLRVERRADDHDKPFIATSSGGLCV